MNGLSSLAGQRGVEISVVLAVLCALVACGVFAQPTLRPTLAVATALGVLFWIAEGLGAIFTGQGTDPNTGPLLILLAACFWPRSPAGAERAAILISGQGVLAWPCLLPVGPRRRSDPRGRRLSP